MSRAAPSSPPRWRVVVVAALLLVAVAGLLAFLWQRQVESDIRQGLAAEGLAAGSFSLSLLPAPQARLGPIGAAAGDGWLSADRLDLDLRLWPLLLGRAAIERIVLLRPDIRLDGLRPEAAARLPQRLRLVDGTVRRGGSVMASGLDAGIDASGPAGSASIAGSLILRGQAFAFDLAVDRLSRLSGGEAAAVAGSVASDLLSATFEGRVSPTAQQGELTVSVPSAAALAAWLSPGTAGGPAMSLRLGATLRRGRDAVRLDDLALDIGGTRLFGDIALALDAEPSRLSGGLRLDPAGGGRPGDGLLDLLAALPGWSAATPGEIGRLDVDLALGPEAAPLAVTAPDAVLAAETAPDGSAILTATAASLRVEGDAVAAGGAVTATLGGRRPHVAGRLDIDRLRPAALAGRASPAALRSVDLDLDLGADRLTVGDIAAGPASGELLLSDGLLSLSLRDVVIGEGTADLRLGIDALGPGVSLAVDAFGVPAALLGGPIGPLRPSGSIDAELALTAAGDDLQAWLASLEGEGRLMLTGGSIEGLDLAARPPGNGGATPFTVLGGGFTVRGGVVETHDARVLGPAVALGGTGTLSLPEGRLSLTLAPLAPGAAGETVVVEGPFDRPSVRPPGPVPPAPAEAAPADELAPAAEGPPAGSRVALSQGLGQLVGQGAPPPAAGGIAAVPLPPRPPARP